MGNANVRPLPKTRLKKQVHWKAGADRTSAPGKPFVVHDKDAPAEVLCIRWTPPSQDGGGGGVPVNGYLVEHRKIGSNVWTKTSPLLVGVPELAVSGLDCGWRYQFRVSAENSVGLSDPSEASEPVLITEQKFLITPPKFTQELHDQVVIENEQCEFVVHFMGQPPPKVCWFRDGFELFSSRRTKIHTENGQSVLTIHQAAFSDEGEIKCSATNKVGHASTKAQLSLEAPPTIRLPRQYEEGLLYEIGDMIRLKVSIAGKPTPLVFWSHNNDSLKTDDRHEIQTDDSGSSLRIEEALRSDRGEYQIRAVNRIGSDSASFLVTVTDKPSPPGKTKVIMTLGRSVTLSWDTPIDDGGCKVGNYIIEYYRVGWDVWLKASTSRQLTTILGDLIEGSEYKFRVKAESPYGISEPSEESELIFIPDTKRGLLVAVPTALRSDNVTVPLPVPSKRKFKARSQSSSRAEQSETEKPQRPERKLRSQANTPNISPLLRRRPTYDSNSYHKDMTGSQPANEQKSPKANAEEKPTTLRPPHMTLGGSSEFMLLLYPANGQTHDEDRISQMFDIDEIPPPMSLSAPELSVEPPTFYSLRCAISSTELLFENTMSRLHSENEKRDRSSPPVLVHDSLPAPPSSLVERRGSFKRRYSAGGVTQEQSDWVLRRYSLRNPDGVAKNEQAIAVKTRLAPSALSATISTSGNDQRFGEITTTLPDKPPAWFDDYEESISEEESFLSGDGRETQDATPVASNTSIATLDKVNEPPFEILQTQHSLPDPDYRPKPILKKLQSNVLSSGAVRSSSSPETPRPRESRSFSWHATQPKVVLSPKPSKKRRDRSFSLIPTKLRSKSQKILRRQSASSNAIASPIEKTEGGHSVMMPNVAAVAEISALTATSIVLADQLIKREASDADREAAKVTIEHYGDILRDVSAAKKPFYSRSNTSHLTSEYPACQDSLVPSGSEENVASGHRENVHVRADILNAAGKICKEDTTWSDDYKPSINREAAFTSTDPGTNPNVVSGRMRAPMLREIMTQTSIGLERNVEIHPRAPDRINNGSERRIRSAIEYLTDVAMFSVACWFYLFDNELFALPILFFMVLREVQDGVQRIRWPNWRIIPRWFRWDQR